MCYGLILGLGSGLLSISSLWPCWGYFGNTNAKMTGFILIGYSLGPAVLGLAFTHLVNPHNYTPEARDGQADDIIYPDSVSQRVPAALLSLSISCLIIGLLSIIFISEKQLSKNSILKYESREEMSYSEIFHCSRFWRMLVITYFQYFMIVIFKCYYKILLLKHVHNDQLVAYSGSIGFISNAFGRFVWTTVLDMISYNQYMGIMNCLGFLICVTMPMVWEIDALAIVWVCGAFFAGAGLYPASIIECGRSFGEDNCKKVFPIVMLGSVMNTITASMFTPLGNELGYDVVMYLVGCLCLVTQFVIVFWKVKTPSFIKPELFEEELIKEIDVDIINS